MFMPTTKVTILENVTKENDFGDDVDDYKAVAKGVGCHIWEQGTRLNDPTTGQYINVKRYRAMLPAGTRIDQNWRIKDERTGAVYAVSNLIILNSFVHSPQIEVELKLTNK